MKASKDGMESVGRLSLILLCGLGSLLLMSVTGCAPAVASEESRAWSTLCANAPFTAGMEISYAEQRAMTTLEVWKLSVEELNAQCQTRH